MTYAEWEANRRYRIVKSHGDERGKETLMASGRTWEEAKAERVQLQDDYDKQNPRRTSWSSDLFLIQMETPGWKPIRG